MNASTLRSRLTHPVIDADGHWLEFGPGIRERLREVGGDKALAGYSQVSDTVGAQLRMSVEERKRRRTAQQAFWSFPTQNTRDRATAMLPGLLYERLDEFGFDYSILYPTSGMATSYVTDAATRRATCRAFNIVTAEHFADYADRLTPAAVIPMHTPEEAIAELEFVTKQLGLKVVVLASLIPRHGETGQAIRTAWRDVLALDSEHDYDPVWAKCVELGLSPTFHAGGRGFAMRRSPSNFVYNHIGHFRDSGEAICKAFFLGGVTRRFPQLRMAFLECGSSFGVQLLVAVDARREARHVVRPAQMGGRVRVARAKRELDSVQRRAGFGYARFQAPPQSLNPFAGGEFDPFLQRGPRSHRGRAHALFLRSRQSYIRKKRTPPPACSDPPRCRRSRCSRGRAGSRRRC